MSRIRTIKPDHFMDEALAEVSLAAHFLLSGLWGLADREGRMEERPRYIKAQVFPYRDIQVEPLLAELERVRRIVRYDVGGQRYIEVENWARDQRPHVREAPSTYPGSAQAQPRQWSGTTQVSAMVPDIPATSPPRPLGSGMRDQGSEIRDLGSIPPKAPQGAREPREGDPCEEHTPPRTATSAPQVALESFAPEPPKPKTGEWTIPDAVDAVHRVVYDGKAYGWDPAIDGPAALVLKGFCDAEGIPPEKHGEEIGRRLGRAMARFHRQFEPGVGKSQTLKRLANRDCWRANAEPPTRQEQGRDALSGVAKPVTRVLEPWSQVDPRRRAA